MNRRSFLRGILAALLALHAACGAQGVQAAPRELRFIVMGDWGTLSSGQKATAEAMARYADANKATSPVQFVALMGDNFYDNGVSGVDDPQWQTKFEQMYDPVRLPMPFIAVLGNHDWRDNPAAQIAYAGSRLAAGKSTRWQMDGFYFKRTYFAPGAELGAPPLADIFFIDTSLWNYGVKKLADAQMKWLEDGLKNSKAQWQFVAAHHPIYSEGSHGRESEILRLRDLLAPVFKKHGVDVFFAGHDHDLQRLKIADHPTMFVVSGGGGAGLRPRKHNDFGPFFQSTNGFAGIVLTPTELRGEFIDAAGKVIHAWTQTPVAPAPVAPAPAAPAP